MKKAPKKKFSLRKQNNTYYNDSSHSDTSENKGKLNKNKT